MSNVTLVSHSNNRIIAENDNQQQVQQGVSKVELKNGATIKGTVISVENTETGKVATINIGDGTISAKLSEDMGLRQGQTLSFSVRSVGNNTATITPLYENTSVDQSTLKALNAAGIPINNDTVEMVKSMMEANQPINKESLLEMNKNLQTYSDTSISTLVEMKSLNIPITENNIEQYTNYKNYQHQVINDMQEIISELPVAFNDMVASRNDTSALQLYGNILKMISSGIPDEGAVNIMETGAGENVVLPKDALALQSAENGEVSKETAIIKENTETLLKLSDSLFDNLKNAGLSEKTVTLLKEQFQSGNVKPAMDLLFKELELSFEKTDLTNPMEAASWKKIFGSEDYNKLLKNNITEQWLLKPDDVQKKASVDEFYQRLGNQAKALAETVNNTALAGTKLGQAANNLSNNLDFMNQLNHMFQYIQLPLQMTGQNVHGDLYVYRNKYKKASEDGSVSAALHLDMENLGPVDVYVKMMDTKVTTNFYVADESALDLINDNIHILDERLSKRGYSLQINLQLHDDLDGNDLAVDEMLSVSKMPVISTASFDARA